MTLTDAGPLVALADEDDDHHDACAAALRSLPDAPLLTTWPCYTEAMFLLYAVGGHRYQAELWDWRRAGDLIILEMTDAEVDRMAELMARYQNVPMSLADASLVAVAEARGFKTIFTVDSDFYIYRLKDKSALVVIP